MSSCCTRLFHHADYNAGDEAAIDAMDVLEGALQEHAAHSRQQRGGAKASVLDSAMAAEIKEGTDRLTEVVLKAHQKPGDVLEMYWRKNIFEIGEPYRPAVRDYIQAQRNAAGPSAASTSTSSSAGAAAGSGGGGDVAERHKQLAADIADLEAALAQVRAVAAAAAAAVPTSGHPPRVFALLRSCAHPVLFAAMCCWCGGVVV